MQASSLQTNQVEPGRKKNATVIGFLEQILSCYNRQFSRFKLYPRLGMR